MALKLPGLRERIIKKYAEMVAANPSLGSGNKFAQTYGFSQSQASDWFSEKKDTTPDFPNLVRLAEVYGVPWQWLAVGDGDQTVDITFRPRRDPGRSADELRARMDARTESFKKTTPQLKARPKSRRSRAEAPRPARRKAGAA